MTCGHDCDIRIFTGIDDDDVCEFTVSSESIRALACYQKSGRDFIAIATDDNTVQAYTLEVSVEVIRGTASCIHTSVKLFYLSIMSPHNRGHPRVFLPASRLL